MRAARKNIDMAASSEALLRWARQELEAADVASPALDARLLLAHAMGCTPEALLGGIAVATDPESMFRALVARRAAREPLAKILGYREFWKHRFFVSAETLDPRPETETVIEAVLALRPNRQAVRSVLDLGTGTGCLLLSLLGEYSQAQGIGVDLSAAALTVAADNARQLGLLGRVELRQGDWFTAVTERFDVIVSNPPYIAASDRSALMPEVREHDPALALFAGAEGLDAYRAILPRAAEHLTEDGLLALELGAGQEVAVRALGEACGLTYCGTVHDLAGIPRVILFQPSLSA